MPRKAACMTTCSRRRAHKAEDSNTEVKSRLDARDYAQNGVVGVLVVGCFLAVTRRAAAAVYCAAFVFW